MFCKNCGTKAIEKVGKFCMKCGTQLVDPFGASPHSAAPPIITPAQHGGASHYYTPQPVTQRTKPVSVKKSKFIPIFIASVSVVAVALVVVALYFALGMGNSDRTDSGISGSIRGSSSGAEEVSMSADDNQVPTSESRFMPERATPPPPEAAVQDEANSEFSLTEDGSGFIFRGIEFQVYEFIINPMVAPADMPSGNTPIMLRLIFTPDADAEETRSLLYETGYFMVGNERATFGAAMLLGVSDNQEIYSLVSSCSRITDRSSVTLHIGDYAFTVQ